MSKNNPGSAARLAAAAVRIAKGAASGGLHGAAVGALRSFLPEIIKAAVIIVAALIIVPVLVFSAIPNILFGYGSAQAEDVVKLTEQANSIDAAYGKVENYSQEYIDRIIAEAWAVYSDDEEESTLHETEINAELDNTNIYWFIAITSVAYQQDLYAMNEDAIKKMALAKLTYVSNISSRTEGEGEAAVIIKTLTVDVQDLDPEALMDKLGFSEEERNWAHVLYATLAEDQYVGFSDSDGAGWYNTDYGDITFSDATTEVVYYNQTDSRWGNIKYGKTGTIGTSGCGPTALTIVVASLIDSNITPQDVAAWSVKNGYRCEGNGSYHSLIPEGGRHYGLQVEGIGNDAKKLVQALEDGKLVIAIMSKGHFTRGGHFIVLRGVTADGKILVADPSSLKRSNQEWALSLIVNEASRKAGAGGPFWVLSLP